MFETVAPETFQARSKRLFYETLPLSIAIHGLAIAAAVATAMWQVAFPDESPRVSVAYSLTRIPDPPPPPPAPKPAPKVEQPKAPPPPPAVLKLAQELAPAVIPDKIPDIVPEPPAPEPQPQPVAQPMQTTTAGDPNGKADGILGGDIAGKVGGKLGGVPWPEDGRVHITRDEKLPLEVVQQDYPAYPDEAKKRREEDQVVVRYVIGTDGRVKDIEIIDHAKDKVFDDAAVDAIRRWRFRPMVKEGKRVEVMHELAINFQMVFR